MANGYYYAAFSEVDIQCYDPPAGANSSGSSAYVYNNLAGTNNTVAITNDKTVLKSLLGTGTNMSADYPSASASASGAAASSEVATVPGLSGAGPGTNGQRGDSSSAVSDGASGTASASKGTSTGFSQGIGGNSGSPPRQEKGLEGSGFAAVVAIVALISM